MPIESLIASGGLFNPDPLRALPSDQDDAVSLVSVLSVHGSNHRLLLDQLFETSFDSSPSAADNIISTIVVDGHDSAILAEPPRHLCVLDVEPYDGPDAARDELRDLAWSLSVALSDLTLFIVRMRDLNRVHSSGLAALTASLTQMLMLRSDSIVPAPSSKRAFLVVVHNYEADVVSRNDIVQGFLNEIQSLFFKIAKPPRSPARITDIFEFEFVLLPDDKVDPHAFETAIDDLRDKLLEPSADDYIFEGSAYAHDDVTAVAEAAQNAWAKMEKERTQDMPPSKDLMSAFDCDNAMRKVFEKFNESVRNWKRETDGGVVIEGFGAAASDIVKKTISVYEQDASPHKGAKAFSRKRDELKDLLDADLYNLFVVQIAKLREVTYRMFKDKLDEIDDTQSNIDKQVNTALKDSQKAFRKNAEALRPSFSSWRYDNDEKELSTKMREDATDMLQRARIADYQEGGGQRGRRRRAMIASAAPKKRQPISVGFHYLDPAPFGYKDSRFQKLNHGDGVELNTDAPLFGPGTSGSGRGDGRGDTGGLAVPLAPARNSGWQRSHQDFIYSERK